MKRQCPLRKPFAAILSLLAVPLIAVHAGAAAPEARPDPLDAYNVSWDSLASDSSGSMPLGNGDIGLNVWVEPNGDILFYVSKTDAWDENCRLVKLGRVRLSLSPNPLRDGMQFRQTLRLRQAEIEIRGAGNTSESVVRIWADAGAPVIRVEIADQFEISARASVELWRIPKRQIQGEELGGAYGLENSPSPVIAHPDTLLPAGNNMLRWFHRNTASIWADTLKLQGMGDFIPQSSDPLMNRTFGCLMSGDGFVADGDAMLRSEQPRGTHTLLISVLTAVTPTPEGWIEQAERLHRQARQTPIADARAAHLAWWNSFWNRSWIRVNPAAQTGFLLAPAMVVNTLPLRIGADSDARNRFLGDIDNVRLFNRALRPEQIAANAAGESIGPSLVPALVAAWDFEKRENDRFPSTAGSAPAARIIGETASIDDAWGRCLRLNGNGFLEVAPDRSLDLTTACTLEARVRPAALPAGGGRIIDKSTAGKSDGYLLDTHPGNSLRMIVQAGSTGFDAKLPQERWSHVAATFDARTGEQCLYINGKRVAGKALAGPRPDISQSYALQRFISACAGRGAFPIKFNGSIFTVEPHEPGKSLDPDYRRWGGPYWFQNTRLAYWPMLASGDHDLMPPLFRMFRDAMPFLKARTRAYFGHDGAFFPETMYFWGAYANSNYGLNRAGKAISDVDNTYIRRHFNGTLELLAIMLDYHAYTQDAAFVREQLLPCADEFLTFWSAHWKRDERGLLRMQPAQALETWQDAINPAPDIAGLRWVMGGLLALPEETTGAARRGQWQKLLSEVPPLPRAPRGGLETLLPAQQVLGPRGNIENPELYAIFPFRLFGVGKPDLRLARDAYGFRETKASLGWHQDDIQAAFLGLADEAAKMVSARFMSPHPAARFPAFWGPNYDWVPDQDHGCNGMMALQTMLLQADGDRILLLPAWPRNWDVEFKLHAPRQTVVECVYRGGRIQELKITPESRRQNATQPAPQ